MPFRAMLGCNDVILTDENYDQISYPVIASAKLDGRRCRVDENNNPLSRTNKFLPNNFTHKEIVKAKLAGFDGELLASAENDPNAMQLAHSAFSTIEGEPDFTFHIFDNWYRGKQGFSDYMHKLKAAQRYLPEWAFIIPQHIITSPGELAVFVKQLTDNGYEGAVVRSLNSPYKQGRSTWKQGWMLKAKDYARDEGTIIGLSERMTNINPAELDERGYTKRTTHRGNKYPADTLGSFIIQDKDGLTFSIGTGSLTNKQKKVIWDDRNSVVSCAGKIVTYKHFAQSGVRNKPRHGQFVSFRDVDDMG